MKATAPVKFLVHTLGAEGHGLMRLVLFVTCGSFWVLVPCVPEGLKLLATFAGFQFKSHAYILFQLLFIISLHSKILIIMSIVANVDTGSQNS